jgi:uncharacterized protein YqcC (DUF446 family)
VLIDIESELRRLALWEETRPSADRLASDQPFAMDTLTLPQWLQFIFLPTMYELLESERPLPEKCGIAPMAEEFFRGSDVALDGLLSALEAVDQLLSGETLDYSIKSKLSASC